VGARSTKQIFGYSQQEPLERLAVWIEHVHPDDREPLERLLQQQLSGHLDTYEIDHRVQRRDGTYRWIRARGGAQYANDGSVVRIAGWHTDITERKQEEQRQLRHAQHASFRADVSMALAERATLRTTLQRCTEAMVQHFHAAFARIWTLKPETSVLILQASSGEYTSLTGSRASIPLGADKIGHIARKRQPYLTNDALNDPRIADKEWASREHMVAFAGYPLLVDKQVVGVMAMFSHEPLMQDTLDALATVAQAIAQGIGRKWAEENAELYVQARDLAVLQERQRIARELHDSVSQALYGIVLGARTARALLDRDPHKLAEPLDYILALAETGLTEMRSLIFELRPEALETEGLVNALLKQAQVVQMREGLKVVMDLGTEPSLPFQVKEALYRVVQEAIYNSVKHAHAQQITVRLSENATGSFLDVIDDGVGFDPNQSFPHHLGLRSMHERVALLGGLLQITSSPGMGTHIHAIIPAALPKPVADDSL
jgi:PAS domain S-box-containing protein